MVPNPMETHSFSEYLSLMDELLLINSEVELNEESSLYSDWGIDSLQAFELILLTEQLAGVHVPPSEIPELYTTGDAYRYYLTCFQLKKNRPET